jgi:hypothetical protein
LNIEHSNGGSITFPGGIPLKQGDTRAALRRRALPRKTTTVYEAGAAALR